MVPLHSALGETLSVFANLFRAMKLHSGFLGFFLSFSERLSQRQRRLRLAHRKRVRSPGTS